MALTRKQQQFVLEYLVDLNATQAAIRAGYSSRSAYSIGEENLKKPELRPPGNRQATRAASRFNTCYCAAILMTKRKQKD